MRYELTTTETGRRCAEVACDGIGEITVLKKTVTRKNADEFDANIDRLVKSINDLSKQLGKVKDRNKKKEISKQLFDVNAEFIIARMDGITAEQLSSIDVSDIAEFSLLANKLFEHDFAAKKNG